MSLGREPEAREGNAKPAVSFCVRGGVELQHARNVGRSFAPHFHDEYQIMVVTAGSLWLDAGGVEHRAAANSVCALAPREVHAGRPDGWGWECSNFYVPVAVMQAIAQRLGIGAPAFQAPVLNDAMLAGALAMAHEAAREPDADETAIAHLHEALGLLIARHARSVAPERPAPRAATRKAQAYIRAHFAERITLEQLAAVAGLSSFHFLRVFARETKLTPHAFQNQVRLAHAVRRLRQGVSGAEAASEAGYSDQSHLIRMLQRSHGLTPGLIKRAH